MDQIIKAISENGFVSINVIDSRSITERARVVHNCTPVVTAALGRTLAASSLIGSSMKKSGASLTVRISGGGSIGSILVVSDNEGNVRGFVGNPAADAPKRADGKLNVGAVVGTDGLLTVIKDFGEREPYTGSTALVSGEIAEDFTAYFAASEQIPTACAFGVLVDRDRTVLASGGYIVQLLPGAPESIIDQVEANVKNTGNVTDILNSQGADALLESVMSGFSPKIIERENVQYRCTCNRERFLNAVRSLDKTEIDDMVEKAEPIEVCCQFCEQKYLFEPSELVGHV
jgi:molecular chaperone Hsp33